MHVELKMSMMGELKFLLGLQIKQTNNGIHIPQTKYIKELLKKFKLKDAKEMKTPMWMYEYRQGFDDAKVESNKVASTNIQRLSIASRLIQG